MKDAQRLWKWFEASARDLPWRKKKADGRRDPYRVWLAEIMLQQTQVTTVIPYYQKFLKHYPTLKKLANAPVENILADWAGLGYYSRARNLHRCAQFVAHELKSKWPQTAAELQKLPGLGPYTAAAMAALAFRENVLAIDGNVARVITRYGAIKTPVEKARMELLRVGTGLLYAPAKGGSAEALIELGALICTPRKPKCNLCPLNKNCQAHLNGEVEKYPIKTAARTAPQRKAAFVVLTDPKGEVLTITRGAKGLFAGMLALPSSALQKGEADHALLKVKTKSLGGFSHVLTHIRFEIEVRHAGLSASAANKIKDGAWLPAKTASARMPKIFQKAVALYQGAE